MKAAFISDIHGNAQALEAVLTDIESKQVDQIIVLGDICFRGIEPKRSLELVRSLQVPVVKGNADEWVVRGIRKGEVPDSVLEVMRIEREWTYGKLDESDIDFLKQLPTVHTFSLSDTWNVLCFHATPTSLFDIVTPTAADHVVKEKLMAQNQANLYLYGHIHLPYVRFIDGKIVANLGSVGLPFDGVCQASYLLVDGAEEQFSVTIQRVSYDIHSVCEQIEASDYPNPTFLQNVLKHGKPQR
ncbi:metallophosphoesterase family protein [Halalkalibacterium halodurans]|jgi:putative phosphoesterase|uniref:BH1859 protein n=2 Tax=Halalkalibacterium halodurans TaxID=86665 RepID=Q9KBR6_HALH5|nr:metallophosphoesterase family protein [Halalkalibacterium halodurans]MED4171788.1 metallophosphoesterase family protein [Halalkalibacterium halodurans]TPE70963.1 metallophosphoesterase family protein [Halalkalibacterium halodurans]BAB05578.1 BH1859 [Halalkalibacterium halodurans C-125]